MTFIVFGALRYKRPNPGLLYQSNDLIQLITKKHADPKQLTSLEVNYSEYTLF